MVKYLDEKSILRSHCANKKVVKMTLVMFPHRFSKTVTGCFTLFRKLKQKTLQLDLMPSDRWQCVIVSHQPN